MISSLQGPCGNRHPTADSRTRTTREPFPVTVRIRCSRVFQERRHVQWRAVVPKRHITLIRSVEEKQQTSVSSSADVRSPDTAKAAVESGLTAFNEGSIDKALGLFYKAMELSPTEDEARAACYNSACAHTKLKQYKQAADQVVKAVNDYGLKLEVAVKDPDLRDLRETREWLDVLEVARGGLTTDTFIKLRAEAKAPFRLARLFLFGGLGAGAGLGLFIITARLISAIRGGDGAPDLTETLQNFVINSAAFALLSFLFVRDIQSQDRDQRTIQREEMLGRLQIQISPDKIVPLARFRGTVRPVLVAGSKSHVDRAIKAALPFQSQLRERGISVVPLVVSSADPDEKLLKLKREWGDAGASTSETSRGFKKAEKSGGANVGPQDRKWELQAYDVDEWRDWLVQQKAAANVTGDNVFVQVQLDGTVRSSGIGTPPWEKFLGDLDTLDSVRTKFTDGIGTSR